MKKVILSAFAVSVIGLTAFTGAVSEKNESTTVAATQELVLPAAATTYNVDTQKSALAWEAKKVTGQHNGLIKIKNGKLQVDNKKPVSGSFDIDMTSITVLDIEDPGYNKKLVDHLKNDDFFSVDKHPTANFKTVAIAPITNAKAGGATHNVRGNLTIKGITQPVSFPATITTDGKTLRAVAEITIDRSKFDVRYGSTSFFDGLGDKAIYNDIKFNLDLVAAAGA